MKRIYAMLAAAALFGQATSAFAQDANEPSLQSVLEAARAKYWHESKSGQDTQAQDSDPQAPSPGAEASDKVPYTPVLVSVVPGISFPFGYYDASLVCGSIGTLARDVVGMEGAGVFNLSRDVRGLQEAGVFNLSRDVKGLQGAGVFNLSEKAFGLEGAGVFNIVDQDFTGIQGAGVFNMVRGTARGLEGAGVFNIAGAVKGAQAAGIFNKAEEISGVQMGLINIAGRIDGVQLGLINIAGNGVDALGFEYEPQTDFLYSEWQQGTPMLYSIAYLGAPAGDWLRDFTSFVGGFGLGSRGKLLGLNLDLDLSAESAIGALQLDKSAAKDGTKVEIRGWDSLLPYPTVRLTLGLPLGKRLQIVGGCKADIDLDSLGPRVPLDLKVGNPWTGAICGEGFTVWPKWFLGLKI
jgi:hypothetical protein